MKSAFISRFIPVILALSLAACASPNRGPARDIEHKSHHPDQATPATSSNSVTPGDGRIGMMDMKSMCEMYKNMMTDQNMKSMHPEMQRQRMEMMSERCKP